jgi:UDP-glucose 4-epimerase
MPKHFPAQPSLEHFRKQAKQLLRDLRAGQADAVARARRVHPRWSNDSDFSLHDAHLVVAREFGFSSWRRLQEAVALEQAVATGCYRALITGGGGFIGSHLAETLVARGHHVVALDNLSSGSRANVSHLRKLADFELVVGDVCDADLVDRLVAGADVVFHLAACIRDVDPLELWRTNIDGSEVVVEATSRHGVRFVLASSSVVYGKTEGRGALKEDADLILGADDHLGWDYAISKIANERLTKSHVERHNLQATVVRLFNVVGPRSQGAAVPTFLGQALARKPITIFGDGSHRRCFTDVRDAVEGLARLAVCDDAHGEIVNIGSRNDLSLTRLVGLVRTVTHSDSPVEHVPFERVLGGEYQRHIPWKTPNLAKARKLIGYTAAHPIDECLQEMLAADDNQG